MGLVWNSSTEVKRAGLTKPYDGHRLLNMKTLFKKVVSRIIQLPFIAGNVNIFT
jgi:hypothetical protein